MHSLGGWRSRTPLLIVILGIGVAFGLFASSAARADDPPPTTVATPTLPTPVPAPVQPPVKTPPLQKPKPPARSTPAWATTTSGSKSRAAPPTAPTPAHTGPTVVSPPTRAQPTQVGARGKKAQRKAKAAIRPQRRVPAAKVKAHQTLGASVGFLVQPKAKSGNSLDVSFLFVILSCTLGVACFLIAVVPVAALPWRPLRIFVSDRQQDLTFAGVALLAAALWVYGVKGR
jgi:hypothetical protein